jgi:hypothetical protein
MTLQQLKTAVLEQVSADWVRENFGKLTLKATWQAAYDRCQEFISAKTDEVKTAIQSPQGQAVITATKAVAYKGAMFTMDAAIWVIKAAVVTALVILELCQEGSIDRLTGRAQTTAETVRRKYSELDFKDLRAFQIRNMAIAEGIPTTNPETGTTYGKQYLTSKLLEVPA